MTGQPCRVMALLLLIKNPFNLQLTDPALRHRSCQMIPTRLKVQVVDKARPEKRRGVRTAIPIALFPIEAQEVIKVVTRHAEGLLTRRGSATSTKMKSTQEGQKGIQVAACDRVSTWVIPSNSGDKTLSLTLLKKEPSSGGMLLRITFEDRAHWGAVSTQDVEWASDFCAVVEPVRIDGSAMAELLKRMEGWLDDFNSFELMLSSEEDLEQSTWIRLGPDARFISSSDKPVVEFSVRRGETLATTWAFVVDQSCIREFIFGRS